MKEFAVHLLLFLSFSLFSFFAYSEIVGNDLGEMI